MSRRSTVVLETGLPVSWLVVPLDGSPLAERSLGPARGIAERLGARVHLLNVSSSPEEAELHRTGLSALAAAGDLSWEVVLAERNAEAIEATRDRLSPALVCMATHGRGRNAVFVGSVATAVLRHSDVPALLVGPRATLGETQTKRLVVCVDGTPESEGLVTVAAAWASALGLAISIVTVAEPVPESVREHGHYGRMFGPDIDGDQYIAGLVGQWRDRIPGIDGTAIYNPVTVGGAVVEHLETEPPALVLLGTRARTGLPRLVLGSVAATVVHESPCPALVFPLQGGPA
jgi:nucleotide-binding universal stress UspA family protein